MPIYEYECTKGHKHELIRSMSESDGRSFCPICGQLAHRVFSLAHFYMGWKFLKNKSEKSLPAPSGSAYQPEWDQAYGP
ncbi:MAG: zinc ribbon domain-containing protein [Proteobacteria bacterium]|nr:zinc ribbon domain-containing protein [Pseudomonadota bacterium]